MHPARPPATNSPSDAARAETLSGEVPQWVAWLARLPHVGGIVAALATVVVGLAAMVGCAVAVAVIANTADGGGEAASLLVAVTAAVAIAASALHLARRRGGERT